MFSSPSPYDIGRTDGSYNSPLNRGTYSEQAWAEYLRGYAAGAAWRVNKEKEK